MAGMFYSIQEVAQELKISEEQIHQLVQQGKLREFRDGSSLLFKVDEVTALRAETSAPDADPQEQPQPPQEDIASETSSDDDMTLEIEPQQEPQQQPAAEELAENDDFAILDDRQNDEYKLAEESPQAETNEKPDEDFLNDILAETTPAPGDDALGENDLLDETDASDEPNLLEETIAAAEDLLSDDTLSETRAITPDDSTDDLLASGGTDITNLNDVADEASLQEIEDDVNLDTFGSGSGLLDLSLQADDTSLGGILDEIYTDDDGSDSPNMGGELGDANIPAADIFPDENIDEPAPIQMQAMAYAEPAPDRASDILGITLFLPLLTIIYTIIIAVTGHGNIRTSLLSVVKPLLLPIFGGILVLAIILSIIGLIPSGGPKAPKKPKPKKEKKVKEPKLKKEKKVKVPKPKKEKKEKKSKKK